MKKKFVFIIVCLIIIIAAVIYSTVKINEITQDTEAETKTEKINETEEILSKNENAKIVDGCVYNHFYPSFENGYDYTQDMEYQFKIYHKLVTTYEDYLKCRERWGESFFVASKENFENNFMVITAIENTSMLGLTLSNVYTDEDTLYIKLNSYPEGEGYDREKTCIAIMIPNSMKKNNIRTIDGRDREKTPEEEYGWIDEPTDGLEEISEDEAIEIAIEYAKELKTSGSYMGQYLDNYTKVYEVKKTTYHPNNYWLIEEGIIERNLETASFTRDVYEVTLVSTDDEMEVNRAYFYVDVYTGEVIAGREAAE